MDTEEMKQEEELTLFTFDIRPPPPPSSRFFAQKSVAFCLEKRIFFSYALFPSMYAGNLGHTYE